jgi:hypothetical protein
MTGDSRNLDGEATARVGSSLVKRAFKPNLKEQHEFTVNNYNQALFSDLLSEQND